MKDTNNLSDKIEKLRKEISETIENNLHNITIDEIIDKSNELNRLIVEYHKQAYKTKP
ncbi:aspartyl-phosphate phosphatase Spo0E family protein [Paramaledivibacter caminithermalis]|jgi:hypothetical protein|uniref:Spo0E like sporulation regulatory protein n=1 Tax=Paramaledivibacter caminithermalis (strain DSM 15212 / CIP 107654 / DViRD3) TaxID=1121301 RepID=A0A1M6L4Z8_PARC5|nr:aspartyl-phosphate phosphatase Spo0E family protein [Paramaledivibacter caminithermalis]SHJ66129.1 Spo0E like sporulation regulatory protein [Paramaledivibacter caminithermalis DSM 15212]